MSSAAQILANRLNAASSTGPKTPEGKAASGRNATRHGLSGGFRLLPHESQEEFDALASAIAEEHRPEGDTETFLVDQMIQSRWKLARIERLEALAMEQILNQPGPGGPDAALLAAMGRGNGVLDKLARYAATTTRAWYKALRELQALRNRNRKAEANALDAYIKKIIYAPVPGEHEMKAYCAAVNDFAKKQNEAKSAPARPVLTPEELAHPALRL